MKNFKTYLLFASLVAVVSGHAEESDDFPVSFYASADIESAYICRGYVWDSRPYSAQDAGMAIKAPEARRDLTYGGVGVAVNF